MSYRILIAAAFLPLYASAFIDPVLAFESGSSWLSVAMSPWNIATWLLALVLLLVPLCLGDPYPYTNRRAGLIRRFFGFALDFHVAFFLVAVPAVVIVLLTEFIQTGVFQWRIERSSTSSWIIMMFFVEVLCLVIALSVPMWKVKRSAGQIVLGYGLKAETPMPLGRACRRTLMGYLTMCAFLISGPKAAKREDRRMWHD